MRIITLIVALFSVSPAFAMDITLGAPWDGKKVPKGQQCAHHGGNGATPPMTVTGLPKGTVMVVAEFNDKSYGPLSSKGGHGIIGWPAKGDKATLTSMPEGAQKGPGGAIVVKNTRANLGNRIGYLPPCSGGRGNNYTADIKALDSAGNVLGKTTVKIGRY